VECKGGQKDPTRGKNPEKDPKGGKERGIEQSSRGLQKKKNSGQVRVNLREDRLRTADLLGKGGEILRGGRREMRPMIIRRKLASVSVECQR